MHRLQVDIASKLLETVELPAYSICGHLASSTTLLRLQAKN
jgi:hypothetical protein